MIQFIDTHTHLFAEEFDKDREETLKRAKELGVTRMFMPNIDDTSIEALLALCDTHEGCYPLIGFHPTSVDADWEKRLAIVEREYRSQHPYYGIGEVGLDFYWDDTYRNEQIKVFTTQIEWALEADLPLIIHSRNAHKELMEVMEPYRETSLRGIFHSFGGSEEEALQLLEYKNFMLGINGILTFKKSTLPNVVKQVLPLDRIVLETDSPYLAPVPHRGRRNESSFLPDTARCLAEIYELELDSLAKKTTENALEVFRIAPISL